MELQSIDRCASLTQDFRTLPGDTCPDIFVVQVEAPVNIGVGIGAGSDVVEDLGEAQCEDAELTLTLLENNATRNVLSTGAGSGVFCEATGNSVLAIADFNQAGLSFNVSAKTISPSCAPPDPK